MTTTYPVLRSTELPPRKGFLRPKLKRQDLPVPEPGNVLVVRIGDRYHEGDLSAGALAWSERAFVYEVVRSPRAVAFSLRAPCQHDEADFDVDVTVHARVVDAVLAVRNPPPADLAAALSTYVERYVRDIGRNLSIDESKSCEDRVNAQLAVLVSSPGPLVDHGIETTGAFAKVTLHDEVREHLGRRRRAHLERVTLEDEHGLRRAYRDMESRDQDAERRRWKEVLAGGEVDLRAAMLAASPQQLDRLLAEMREDDSAERDRNLRVLIEMVNSKVGEDLANRQQFKALLDSAVGALRDHAIGRFGGNGAPAAEIDLRTGRETVSSGVAGQGGDDDGDDPV